MVWLGREELLSESVGRRGVAWSWSREEAWAGAREEALGALMPGDVVLSVGMEVHSVVWRSRRGGLAQACGTDRCAVMYLSVYGSVDKDVWKCLTRWTRMVCEFQFGQMTSQQLLQLLPRFTLSIRSTYRRIRLHVQYGQYWRRKSEFLKQQNGRELLKPGSTTYLYPKDAPQIQSRKLGCSPSLEANSSVDIVSNIATRGDVFAQTLFGLFNLCHSRPSH